MLYQQRSAAHTQQQSRQTNLALEYWTLAKAVLHQDSPYERFYIRWGAYNTILGQTKLRFSPFHVVSVLKSYQCGPS